MSTKSSIKWKEQTTESAGYHLYDDVMDYSDDPPVYLRLDGVDCELHTQTLGVSVTVTIPRAIARELGLLKDSPNRRTGCTRGEEMRMLWNVKLYAKGGKMPYRIKIEGNPSGRSDTPWKSAQGDGTEPQTALLRAMEGLTIADRDDLLRFVGPQ